jgi:hypothetical protein
VKRIRRTFFSFFTATSVVPVDCWAIESFAALVEEVDELEDDELELLELEEDVLDDELVELELEELLDEDVLDEELDELFLRRPFTHAFNAAEYAACAALREVLNAFIRALRVG